MTWRPYLRLVTGPPPPSLRVMTKDKSKIKLKLFVNSSKAKINVINFVQSYDKSFRFKAKTKIRHILNMAPGLCCTFISGVIFGTGYVL